MLRLNFANKPLRTLGIFVTAEEWLKTEEASAIAFSMAESAKRETDPTYRSSGLGEKKMAEVKAARQMGVELFEEEVKSLSRLDPRTADEGVYMRLIKLYGKYGCNIICRAADQLSDYKERW